MPLALFSSALALKLDWTYKPHYASLALLAAFGVNCSIARLILQGSRVLELHISKEMTRFVAVIPRNLFSNSLHTPTEIAAPLSKARTICVPFALEEIQSVSLRSDSINDVWWQPKLTFDKEKVEETREK